MLSTSNVYVCAIHLHQKFTQTRGLDSWFLRNLSLLALLMSFSVVRNCESKQLQARHLTVAAHWEFLHSIHSQWQPIQIPVVIDFMISTWEVTLVE